MMIFRYCLCCFGCNQNPPNDSKRLLANQSTSQTKKQHEGHTVSKVSGDARDESYDDDGAYSNYEAALSAKKPNLMGSKTNLAGSATNLRGSRINLTGSSTNITGTSTNILGTSTNILGTSTNITGSSINRTRSQTNLTGSHTNLMGNKTNLMGTMTNLTKSLTNLAGGKTNLVGSQTNILSDRQLIHPSSELQNEIGYDLKKSIIQTSQANPVIRKQDHWESALMKTKPGIIKSDKSLYSMASISMMMLPTITVGSSCSSRVDSSENTINPETYALPKCGREVKSLSSSPKTSISWLKSRSMLDVTCTSYSEDNRLSRSTEDVAQKHGLDVSLYGNTHLSKSMEAVNRAWTSMDGLTHGNVFIDLPYGAIHFIPSYSSDSRELVIRIEKIEGLAPKGVNRSKYDCVIKLTMLPNEKHAKFSKIIPAHDTLDLDECFIFNVKNPVDKVLRISVYDFKFLGKYDAVGHALFHVIDALTHELKSHTLKLYRQPMRETRGESIKIVLHYRKPTDLLNVNINEAYNFPIFSGKSKSYLKLTLYIFGRKVKEIHSPSICVTKQLCYRFSADFSIDSCAFQNCCIVVSVKIRTFFREMLVGRVILGPYFHAEFGKLLTPWGRALINRETVSHVFRLYP